MSATITTSNPPTNINLFLTAIPAEIRLEIYTYLLLIPPPPQPRSPAYRSASPLSSSSSSTSLSSASSHTEKTEDDSPLTLALLQTCRQIRHEATPLLFTLNTFLPSPLSSSPSHCPPCAASSTITPLLTAPIPTLYEHIYPLPPTLSHPYYLSLIRRWYLPITIDIAGPPAWTRHTAAALLSGAEEITIELKRARYLVWGGLDPQTSALRALEGVRGVGRIRVVGLAWAGCGLERYMEWLEGVMKRKKRDHHDEDEEVYVPGCEKEKRRLEGWA